ncbi:hypothetical protein CR513_22501, partial [Mucuna pruriens]
MAGMNSGRKRKACNVLAVHGKADPTPVITFSERDIRYEPPRQDEPMVILVVIAEYKVERVLIDQGSLTKILYWSTYKRLGLQSTDLEACSGKLYGFAGEHVTIKGVIELETMFGERDHAHTIPMLYTIIDVDASYNIIMGRSALNKLGVGGRKSMGQPLGSQTMLRGQPKNRLLTILGGRARCEHVGPRLRPQVYGRMREVSFGRRSEGSQHRTQTGSQNLNKHDPNEGGQKSPRVFSMGE